MKRPNLHKKLAHMGLVLVLGTCLFTLLSCGGPGVDFSEYQGVNLIPNGDFATSDPTYFWGVDHPDDTDGPFNITIPTPGTNNYVNFEAIPNASPWAGYASDAVLRSGLTGDAATASIYRLEVKNLLPGGDFEGGANPFSASGGVIVQPSVGISSPGATYNMKGNWAYLDTTNAETSVIDVKTALTPSSTWTEDVSYATSFRICLPYSPVGYWFGFDKFNTTGASDRTEVSIFPIRPDITITNYYFPFNTPINSRGSTIYSNVLKQYFRLNPLTVPTGGEARSFDGTMDDIGIVRADWDNAIRLNIPVTEAGRPKLLAGGTYTVKLLVRNDNTSTYANIDRGAPLTYIVDNRFDASAISISLFRWTASPNTHGATVVHSRGLSTASSWVSHSDFSTWTELSARFDSPLTFVSGAPALQLVISASNFSSSLKAPGSILVAYPQLYWSP